MNDLRLIIDDILDLSKIQSGRAVLEKRYFDLEELAEHMFLTYGELAHQKQIEFDYELVNVENKLLYGDEVKIRQVLGNLLNNAIKFTETGFVRLIIEQLHMENDGMQNNREAKFIFKVKDTGVGISESDISKLFVYFSQLENYLTKKFKGSGLGLAICKEIVTLMKGEIGVRSEEGIGSEFYFTVGIQIADKE